MKKITLVAGLALTLVLPTLAVAKPTPDKADKRAAQAECKALRGTTTATHEAFRALQKSFVACVRAKSSDEAKEEQSAHTNAAKECKAEGLHGREFGKCVSTKAKAKEAAADAEDKQDAAAQKNAAKECDAERDADADAFRDEHGTNDNKSNAFGKCVSKKVRESEEQA